MNDEQRQKAIIRQSCIKLALEYLIYQNGDCKIPIPLSSLQKQCEEFENYVFLSIKDSKVQAKPGGFGLEL